MEIWFSDGQKIGIIHEFNMISICLFKLTVDFILESIILQKNKNHEDK